MYAGHTDRVARQCPQLPPLSPGRPPVSSSENRLAKPPALAPQTPSIKYRAEESVRQVQKRVNHSRLPGQGLHRHPVIGSTQDAQIARTRMSISLCPYAGHPWIG